MKKIISILISLCFLLNIFTPNSLVYAREHARGYLVREQEGIDGEATVDARVNKEKHTRYKKRINFLSSKKEPSGNFDSHSTKMLKQYKSFMRRHDPTWSFIKGEVTTPFLDSHLYKSSFYKGV